MDKLNEGDIVTIVDECSKREGGYKVFHPKVDKDGFISLEKDGTILRVHPKRILTGDQTMSTTAEAPIETAPVAVAPKVTTAKPKVVPEKVDMNEIASHGELWVKGGIEFDNGKTTVQTLSLLFPTQGRYLSFNTYNETYGKKGKRPPIEQIEQGDTEVGYAIKDLDKLRAKLIREGYRQHGEYSV